MVPGYRLNPSVAIPGGGNDGPTNLIVVRDAPHRHVGLGYNTDTAQKRVSKCPGHSEAAALLPLAPDPGWSPKAKARDVRGLYSTASPLEGARVQA